MEKDTKWYNRAMDIMTDKLKKEGIWTVFLMLWVIYAQYTAEQRNEEVIQLIRVYHDERLRLDSLVFEQQENCYQDIIRLYELRFQHENPP